MPFEPSCFAPEFFFDPDVLAIVRGVLDERAVADQWGCDVPLRGSENQIAHVDYRRPLFPECPDLTLPPYMLLVSFGLIKITPAHGPIKIAPGSHRIPESEMQPVLLDIGDVLVRHPWVLHRGTPNTTGMPRPLVTIRYVRHWYADSSRDANSIPRDVWQSLKPEQKAIMRFPVAT
jgi:ectoine hydroxylase-related dioxygenase (phytanoyl-CoA dioxygenase family)